MEAMRFVLAVMLLSGCDKLFGLDDVSIHPAAGPDALIAGDVQSSSRGCADGVREAFVDQAQLAGCAGSWQNPGIPGAVGDPLGASALCAVGWHICRNGAEATTKGPSDGCASVTDPMMFFATAQRSSGNDLCDDGGNDDVIGCGVLLGSPVGGCGMLNRSIGTLIPQAELGQWSMGSDGKNELVNVTKGIENGGVLCCTDD
jgi:hypothetical protein